MSGKALKSATEIEISGLPVTGPEHPSGLSCEPDVNRLRNSWMP